MTIIELETNDMNKINFCRKMILHYLTEESTVTVIHRTNVVHQ